MTKITTISAKQAADILKQTKTSLIDVREADEYRKEHIPNSLLHSLSKLNVDQLTESQYLITCQSGVRATQAANELAKANPNCQIHIIEGGLNGWKKEGLPLNINRAAPISIMRQVQITAGSLIVLGAVLAQFANPNFIWLSGFVGAGLMFAGISGTCMMASLLSHLPFNKA